MIYLLYGSDTFRSRKFLNGIMKEHAEKSGAQAPAFFRYDAEDADPALLRGYLSSRSLFQKKELVVIERAFSGKKNIGPTITPMIEGWAGDADALFVFWDAAVEKKNSFFSKVARVAEKNEEYQPLEGAEVARWLTREIVERKVQLSSADRASLLQEAGSDLWKLDRELEKIALGGIPGMPHFSSEEKIWDFTDAFLVSRKRALVSWMRLSAMGVDAPYLIGALAKSFRAVFLLKEAIEKGRSPAAAGKKARIHPFVAKKSIGLARSLSSGALASAYALLRSADFDTKTGRLPADIAFLSLFVKK